MKRRNKLSTSSATIASALAKRTTKLITVTGVTMAKQVTVIPFSQFKKLNVDEHYQRVRIGGEVNDLIHVLKAGGQIVQPIDVAERSDGTWWIVDGQQRFWAHSECQMPIRASIHQVESIESETNLFYALNTQIKISARTIAKGWPGIAGNFLRQLNETPTSPLFGQIDMKNNRNLPLDATNIVRALLAVTAGISPKGNMLTRVLPRLDETLKVTGMRAWAEAFVQLVAGAFDLEQSAGRARVRLVVMLALANVAHRHYVAAGRPIFPKTCAPFRRMNWRNVAPTNSLIFLPQVEDAIERRWKQ